MTYLAFTVPGIPIAQGSKRHVGNGRMIESSQHLRPWREAVMAAAIEAADANPDWVPTGSRRATYAVGLRFEFPRPKAHFTASGYVKTNAPVQPNTRPDIDKCLRACFDAFTQSGVIGDDSQIVKVVMAKWYSTSPCLEVQLERLT